MCGICGELRFDGASPDMRAVERMSAQLARRGPDHAGTFADGPLAFGHRRLAVIDLWPSADQPTVDTALQLALMFNGSEGDSEVILTADHAWGEQGVQRFYGIFVFAIWDMRDGHRGSLLLARDRFGIEPLYPTQDGQPGVSVGAARSWS